MKRTDEAIYCDVHGCLHAPSRDPYDSWRTECDETNWSKVYIGERFRPVDGVSLALNRMLEDAEIRVCLAFGADGPDQQSVFTSDLPDGEYVQLEVDKIADRFRIYVDGKLYFEELTTGPDGHPEVARAPNSVEIGPTPIRFTPGRTRNL